MTELKLEKHEDLEKFVKELPESYSHAINLYYQEKMTQKEIADKLNLSVTATRQRLSKAKYLLRKLSGCEEYKKAYQIMYGKSP